MTELWIYTDNFDNFSTNGPIYNCYWALYYLSATEYKA